MTLVQSFCDDNYCLLLIPDWSVIEMLLCRFTEIYVDEMQHTEDLQLLIQRYLEGFNLSISVANGIIK